MNEERKKLIDNLEAWRDCWNTKCEDCRFSDPIAGKRKCTAMDEKDIIDLALKVVKNDEALLKEQEAVKVRYTAMGGLRYGACPQCDARVDNLVNPKACGFCGQELKWE